MNKILKKVKSLKTMVILAILQHGSLTITLKKSILALRKDGIPGVLIRLKKYANLAHRSGAVTDIKYRRAADYQQLLSLSLLKSRTGNEQSRFNSKAGILFIGHDALLAGAQTLLLSLIGWMVEHTGITVKIILLRDGHLFERFSNLAPTLVWQDLINSCPESEKRQTILKQFIGKVDLVYGNTIVTPSVYDELAFLNVPFISHIHELEKTIQLYIDASTVQKMQTFSSAVIACSNPVARNLTENHQIGKEKMIVIHEFVEEKHLDFTQPKNEIRRKLGLSEDSFIVINCGTMYWRKGGDLFIETALKLQEKGMTSFHFYWIGDLFWDYDPPSLSISSMKKLQHKIDENGLSGKITFLGIKENVFDYYLASDVFYLTSREDPFPLVCLEAAQCCLPIICFNDAGGMPEFVEHDAGFVIPFEDVNEAAEKISFLSKNPSVLKEMGQTARQKFLQRHSLTIGAQQIFNYCREIGNINPAVSIIVPSYNYGKFIGKRLESIMNQTFRDFEVIILDDASTDNSVEIITKYLTHPNIKFIKNESNSGNPFKQWYKGFQEAKGEILWFAEADDFCNPEFLKTLLPSFSDYSVALAYCGSIIVDENDMITGDYADYHQKVDPLHWRSSYKASGTEEINYGLGVKNTIPNASAVLVRKSCLTESLFQDLFQFQLSGDWHFYLQVIKKRSIEFHAETLNFHRRHQTAITSKFNADKGDVLLKEAEIIHNKIAAEYALFPDYLKRWDFYITEQINAFYPMAATESFDQYYAHTSTRAKIVSAISAARKNKRLVFITTNDGSANGGSEQLWRLTAIECSRRGYQVMIVIKKWNPEPFFFKELTDSGIYIVLKENNHFDRVISFNPDLVIISIGDQDEGIDYYDQCADAGIPYVIVNQLSKEPKYWPIRHDIADLVKRGYLNAAKVLFTGYNNQHIMEKRLDCSLPNAGVFFNPLIVSTTTKVSFPDVSTGFKLAMPASMVQVQKGQHLALEIFKMKKWRNRQIFLNFYGDGPDEDIFRTQAKDYKLKNVKFHGHINDFPKVWEENHALFLCSYMEGLPLVTVSAMICARLPIVTDVGAHSEVIADNISGFIASKPEVAAIDEALERAWQQRDRWEEIGREARNKILSVLPEDPIDDFISKIMNITSKD